MVIMGCACMKMDMGRRDLMGRLVRLPSAKSTDSQISDPAGESFRAQPGVQPAYFQKIWKWNQGFVVCHKRIA